MRIGASTDLVMNIYSVNDALYIKLCSSHVLVRCQLLMISLLVSGGVLVIFKYPSSQRTHWAGTYSNLYILKLSDDRLVLVRFYAVKGSQHVKYIGLFLIFSYRLLRWIMVLLIT